MGDLVDRVARRFLGVPYRASTLEISAEREVLSANLDGFDCATLVDAALAAARMVKRGGGTPEAMLDEIEWVRYRGGRRTDYTSRLHYTSDWLFDNASKGAVRLLTPGLPGARRAPGVINFMSTHPDAYAALRAHPERVAVIAAVERSMGERETFYLPKDGVAAAAKDLLPGDIVAVTTSTAGLDCSHVGLASRGASGAVGFLHASSRRGRVVLVPDLAGYLASNPSQTGIMAARPLEPAAGPP